MLYIQHSGQLVVNADGCTMLVSGEAANVPTILLDGFTQTFSLRRYCSCSVIDVDELY